MNETVSLEVAIEVVLRNGPTFETIAGLCKMAVEAEREACARECWEFYSIEGIAQKCNAAIRARGDSEVA